MVLGTGYMYTYIYHGTGWRVDGEVFEEVKKIIKVHGFCYRLASLQLQYISKNT